LDEKEEEEEEEEGKGVEKERDGQELEWFTDRASWGWLYSLCIFADHHLHHSMPHPRPPHPRLRSHR